MSDLSHDKLIQNEQTFKERNLEVKDALKRIIPENDDIDFVCECSNEQCHEHIHISPDEYETIHVNPRRYLIKAGHDTPAVEAVVEKHATYEIVEIYH